MPESDRQELSTYHTLDLAKEKAIKQNTLQEGEEEGAEENQCKQQGRTNAPYKMIGRGKISKSQRSMQHTRDQTVGE